MKTKLSNISSWNCKLHSGLQSLVWVQCMAHQYNSLMCLYICLHVFIKRVPTWNDLQAETP